jgi:hypothetical protein
VGVGLERKRDSFTQQMGAKTPLLAVENKVAVRAHVKDVWHVLSYLRVNRGMAGHGMAGHGLWYDFS